MAFSKNEVLFEYFSTYNTRHKQVNVHRSNSKLIIVSLGFCERLFILASSNNDHRELSHGSKRKKI